MKCPCVHVLLALLVLIQPVASAASIPAVPADVSDSSMGHDMTGHEMAAHDMEPAMASMPPDCHDQRPAGVPDCCDDMDGVNCGMDCGTVSSAVAQPATAQPVTGHAVYSVAEVYAAPRRTTSQLFKPPITS